MRRAFWSLLSVEFIFSTLLKKKKNVMGKHKQKQKAEREILHQFLADW